MPYLPGRGKRERPSEEPDDNDVSAPKKAETSSSERPTDIDLQKLEKAYRELAQAHLKIQETHAEMILKFAIAAEFRDPDTGAHILRISDYSLTIAEGIGLGPDERELLRFASPMHDIGKIGIPDSILLKPGRLTPEEWETMKGHTLIGARVFENSQTPMLRAAHDIALTHHERVDGRGYPRGLTGENIPLFGRIVAIADVFDAIVSERCYKKASTFEEGMDYLRTLAGNHLDAALVGVFLRSRDRVRGIFDANKTIQQFVSDCEAQARGAGVLPE